MSRYMESLGAVSTSAAGAKRTADIVAALAPPAKPVTSAAVPTAAPSTALVKTTPPVDPRRAAFGMIPGVLGGAAGAVAWKDHRVLGFLAGHAIGASVYPLYQGGKERTNAFYQLGVEGAGIGGALLWSKHPVFGWLGGILAGALVTSFIPGSPVREQYEKRLAEWKR